MSSDKWRGCTPSDSQQSPRREVMWAYWFWSSEQDNIFNMWLTNAEANTNMTQYVYTFWQESRMRRRMRWSPSTFRTTSNQGVIIQPWCTWRMKLLATHAKHWEHHTLTLVPINGVSEGKESACAGTHIKPPCPQQHESLTALLSTHSLHFCSQWLGK